MKFTHFHRVHSTRIRRQMCITRYYTHTHTHVCVYIYQIHRDLAYWLCANSVTENFIKQAISVRRQVKVKSRARCDSGIINRVTVN